MRLPRSIEASAPSVPLLPVATTGFVGTPTWLSATAMSKLRSPVVALGTFFVSSTRGGVPALPRIIHRGERRELLETRAHVHFLQTGLGAICLIVRTAHFPNSLRPRRSLAYSRAVHPNFPG